MNDMIRAVGITSMALMLGGGLGCNTQVESQPPWTPPPEEAPELLRADAPPIVGGGLLITADQRFAVAADLDRDVVWIIDLERRLEHGRVALEPDDRPNRLVADGEGRVHVALRRGGAVIAIDPYAPDLVARTPVCAAPRGMDYDPTSDTLYVACLHGELLALDPASHAVRRRVYVAPDLRDVVVADDAVWVSTFRSAEVFAVGADDAAVPIPAAVDAQMSSVDGLARHVPRVAWRMAPAPDGARLLHQRHRAKSLPRIPRPSVYYGNGASGGNGVVHGTVAPVPRPGAASPDGRLLTALAVDLAVSAEGALAVADPSGPSEARRPRSGRGEVHVDGFLIEGDGAVAVAWRGADVVSFVREPAALRVTRVADGVRVEVDVLTLAADSRADTGHALFHEASSTNITCAACHPEGSEDGHVWRFDAFGPRRTQTLLGGVSHRAPFHWSGDLPDFTTFMAEVFLGRMGGRAFDLPHPVELTALAEWLDTVPHRPAVAADAEAAARGRLVFTQVGCDACHFADGTVDGDSHDVGTGEPLQVPSLLGASLRLPLMHDGCAETLADRFDPDCGGDDHGSVDALTAAERADLMAYLRAL